MRSQKPKGFTLIELLVVIAIIALLMSILMPALAKVKKQAAAVVCQSNLSSIGKILVMYVDDNNGYLYRGDITNGFKYTWINPLWPYYKDEMKVISCPLATKPQDMVGAGGVNAGGTYLAWAVPEGQWEWNHPDLYGSIGENPWAGNPPLSITAQFGGQFPTSNNWRTPSVKNPHDIPVFADSAWHGIWMGDLSDAGVYNAYPQYAPESVGGAFCIDRHSKKVSMLMMDWSVQYVKLKDLWQFKWHRTYDKTNAPDPEVDPVPKWMQ